MIVLKSLADLPANTLALVASAPMRAVEATRRVMTPPMRASRRQLRAARRRSAEFIKGLSARAKAPLRLSAPWSHGGLNE